MKSSRDPNEDSAFERQARDAFDDSVANLDAATLSRLNRSRQRALDAAGGHASSPRWLHTWVPAGAVAAAALVAVLVLRAPAAPETVATDSTAATGVQVGAPETTLDPLTVVAAGDDLELAAEADLEFYAWVELETAGDGVT